MCESVKERHERRMSVKSQKDAGLTRFLSQVYSSQNRGFLACYPFHCLFCIYVLSQGACFVSSLLAAVSLTVLHDPGRLSQPFILISFFLCV